MRLKVSHTTQYSFDAPAPYGLQQLRMTPKNTGAQTVKKWTISIEGGQQELEFDDYHRNHVTLASFAPETKAVAIRCDGEVELADTQGIIGRHDGYVPLWLFMRETPLTQAGKACRALVAKAAGHDMITRLHDLSRIVREAVAYETGRSETHWAAEDVLRAGHGVCQDHTHVFVSCARAMHAPARYVSGYLMMNGRTSQDAMHAWAEVHVEGLGWVGFDVSNGISPDTRYVRVATGLDYMQAAPVLGRRFGTGGESLQVSVEVVQQ